MAEQNNSQSGNTPISQTDKSSEFKGNQPQGQNERKPETGEQSTKGEKPAIGGGSATGQAQNERETSSDKQAKGKSEDEQGGANSKVPSDSAAR